MVRQPVVHPDRPVDDLTAKALLFQAQLRPQDRRWLKLRGLTDSTIDRYLLGYVAEGRYRNAISLPYLNPDGTVRSIRFRYLQPNGRKYDNLKGQKVHLYNVVHTTKPRVWVCEGEFDSLILTQMGYPAVGVPGVSSFKPDWKYLFVNCEQVSLVFDSDEAGEKGAQRLASILGEVVQGDLRLIRLPEGLDVTDCYLRDPDELRALVS